MTVRHTLAALTVGLVVAAVPATALAVGRPHNMTPAAYQALVAQGQALNARYGNAVTRLSPKQFIELYNDGGSKLSPEALNALVVRSQALNARYGNAVTRLTPKQFIELYNAGGSSTAAPRASTSSSFFAWDDFGIGAAAAVGLILLLGGIVAAARSGRRTRVVAHIG